jgi:hypothetical protein
MHGEFSAPLTLRECGSFKTVEEHNPSLFSITGLSGKDGSPIHGGQTFSQIEGAKTCGMLDRPLSFHGRTALTESANVWALSTTDTDQHYLSPRVQIKAGEWISPNIGMGSNVRKITFIQINAEIDRAYRKQVDNNEWLEQPWPTGAKELATLTYEQERAK